MTEENWVKPGLPMFEKNENNRDWIFKKCEKSRQRGIEIKYGFWKLLVKTEEKTSTYKKIRKHFQQQEKSPRECEKSSVHVRTLLNQFILLAPEGQLQHEFLQSGYNNYL